jgi:hypothetical protein
LRLAAGTTPLPEDPFDDPPLRFLLDVDNTLLDFTLDGIVDLADALEANALPDL